MGRWPPFDDAAAALEQLREFGYRTAILSNTDDDLLAATLKNLGAAPDVTVTAEQVKAYKPDERVFLEGAKRLGLEPQRILHCSFSPYHDLEPAKRLGFQTFWVDRTGLGELELAVDFQARDLRGLVTLLGP
jgi:2-haloacid dehalogenase/putative hydrolase of the HAD superfamily